MQVLPQKDLKPVKGGWVQGRPSEEKSEHAGNVPRDRSPGTSQEHVHYLACKSKLKVGLGARKLK